MKFFAALAALLFAGLAFAAEKAPSSSPVALSDGEMLRYRVRWGLFANAGEITVSARAEEQFGLPEIRITTHTNTRGFVRGFYLFDGDGESVFDARDGRLLAISTWSTSSKKNTKTMAVFDYQKNVVRYVDYVRTERSEDLELPEGNPMDLITCLIETRRWDLKPGERSQATVIFDKDFYDITIVAEGTERIRTPMGEFDTLVLRPVMEKNPRGLFKRGGRVRVWISQDEKRLPVQFEVGMKFGTGTALLTEYRPPGSAGVANDANPHP
ncbi:MAG TPA: DUF3108 domain-containing protein [Opitutaceae bacterium]|nr:DUF3108 domain-containing protein [Opitutaceae bacterium]